MKILALVLLLATTAHPSPNAARRQCADEVVKRYGPAIEEAILTHELIRKELRACRHGDILPTTAAPTSTTTTTLPCTFTVLPYAGGNPQPDACEQTPGYCVTITGCGYTATVPYCIPSEVMDHCAYPGTCNRLY